MENYKQKILDSGNAIPSTLEYWRNPTKNEIKFGHGAMHYRDFDFEKCITSDGSLRLSFIASDDKCKYYTSESEYFNTRKYKAKKVFI